MGLKPRHCLGDPRAQTMGRLEAEQLLGLTHLQAAAGLTVWFGGIPNDIACEADFRRDHLRQLPNSYLFTRAKVEGL